MSASAAALKAPVSEDTLRQPAKVAEAYGRWIAKTGLSDATKRTYGSRVRDFATWLEQSDKHDALGAFTDTDLRNYACRDYRSHLLTKAKAAPSTADLSITAVGTLYDWLGLGKPVGVPRAGRHAFAKEGRRGLTGDQQKDVLRAAERRGVRDLALTSTALFTGLRIAELAALDHDDLWVTDRAGEVLVRAGKGDRPRKVEVPPQARTALRAWFVERRDWLRDPAEPALWVAKATGQRISDRNLRKAITTVGRDAGVDLSPHVLRHTFGEHQAQVLGTDIATVADLMGHSDVQTTRGYQKASKELRADIAERFIVEF